MVRLRILSFLPTGRALCLKRHGARSDRPRQMWPALRTLHSLMSAIKETQLRIPADIAVVGFDDIPAATLVSPPPHDDRVMSGAIRKHCRHFSPRPPE